MLLNQESRALSPHLSASPMATGTMENRIYVCWREVRLLAMVGFRRTICGDLTKPIRQRRGGIVSAVTINLVCIDWHDDHRQV